MSVSVSVTVEFQLKATWSVVSSGSVSSRLSDADRLISCISAVARSIDTCRTVLSTIQMSTNSITTRPYVTDFTPISELEKSYEPSTSFCTATQPGPLSLYKFVF